MIVGFANPVFAWVAIIAILFFVLGMMWKAVKFAIISVIVAVIAGAIFFAG